MLPPANAASGTELGILASRLRNLGQSGIGLRLAPGMPMASKGTSARMEQLCVHALLVQLYATELVSEGEIPPPPGRKGFGGRAAAAAAGADGTDELVGRPVWLGKDYQLQRQPSDPSGSSGWQRGHWRPLVPLEGVVAAPLEWVEPVLLG